MFPLIKNHRLPKISDRPPVSGSAIAVAMVFAETIQL